MKLQAYHKTLDRWFSKFIRLRDTPGKCCTCDKYLSFEPADCGHFITRDRIATRWDERNAHAQCRYCNDRRKGEQAKHLLHIQFLYGTEVVEELMRKSKHPASMPEFEARMLIEKFKRMCKELEATYPQMKRYAI